MARRTLWPGLLAAALAIGLGGCTPDVTDVSERVIITALGLDAAPGGGLVVTASFLSFQKSGPPQTSGVGSGASSGSTDGAAERVVVKAETGETVSDAIQKIAGAIPGAAYFGSTRALVIGADMARSGDLLGALQPLLRLPRLPRNQSVTVVDGTAEEFLRSQTPAADSVSRHLRVLYRTARETDIAYADPRVWELYDAVVAGTAIAVPFVEATKEGPEVVGQGVFSAGRLQRVVGRSEMPYLQAIDWTGPVTVTLGAMPGQTRPFSLTFSSLHIRATLSDDARTARVTIEGSAIVAAGPLRPQTGSAQAAFERFVSQEVAGRTQAMLRSLYAQNIDVLHLAEQVRARTGVRPPPSEFAGIHFEMRPMITISAMSRGH